MSRLVGMLGLALATLLGAGAPPALAQPVQHLVAHYAQENNAVEAHSADKPADAVPAAIRQAAQATGVDYHYLMAKAQLESGFDADAKARTSSAAGLFQFIEGTWLASLDRYGDALSLDQQMAASRQDLLDLRFDPQLAALVAAASARENGEVLHRVLGRRANHTELYLAHFLGSAGASRFLRVWQRDPHAIAASLFPRAAGANRQIFYAASGKARSLEGVLAHFDAKIEAAISAAVGYDPVPPQSGKSEAIWAHFQDNVGATSQKLSLSRVTDALASTGEAGALGVAAMLASNSPGAALEKVIGLRPSAPLQADVTDHNAPQTPVDAAADGQSAPLAASPSVEFADSGSSRGHKASIKA